MTRTIALDSSPSRTPRQDSFAEAELRFWKHESGGEFPHRCYEGEGLRLWQEFVSSAKDYYVLHSEIALIEQHAHDIAQLVREELGKNAHVTLTELGSGSLAALRSKTTPIVNALQPDSYMSIDYSRDVLHTAQDFFAREKPSLPVTTLQADFNLQSLRLPRSDRRLMIQFGSTISNVPGTRDQILPFRHLVSCLENYRRALEPGDLLVIGYDGNQDGQSATDAYRHPAHAAFSLNLLNVMKRDSNIKELRPEDFRYEPNWQPRASLVTHDLVAIRDGGFSLGGEPIRYRATEAFNYSNSYKYPVPVFQSAARIARFEPAAMFIDSQHRVGLHGLRAA